MKYCANCGVELDQSMNECPLCHKAASENTEMEKAPQDFSPSTAAEKTAVSPQNDGERKQNRKLFWELTVLIFFSVAIITLLIDLLTSRHMSWSKYTVGISMVLLVNSSLISFWRHKPLIVFAGSFASIAVLLLLFDYFGNSSGWGLKLGIPLLLLCYVFLSVILLLVRHLHEKGINFIALLLSAASIICVGIEILLDHFVHQHVSMGWSMYVLFSTLPLAGILLFVHYRMKKGRELKRLFHL